MSLLRVLIAAGHAAMQKQADVANHQRQLDEQAGCSCQLGVLVLARLGMEPLRSWPLGCCSRMLIC
ncbi:hypothetical protein [Prochlorococcus sp. MIT 1201]|uniref:hypothetical protein n=1 Tax=Prochlorococcus sp. MIT 1201 TaxID=3082535 RepID=UPI0039A4D1E6